MLGASPSPTSSRLYRIYKPLQTIDSNFHRDIQVDQCHPAVCSCLGSHLWLAIFCIMALWGFYV